VQDIGMDNMIQLGRQNPNPMYSDGRTFSVDIQAHKAGGGNRTGMTAQTPIKPISTGCFLIDRNRWNSFISIFNNPQQRGNIVSLSVSATYAAPINIYGIGGPVRTIDRQTIFPSYR
jgi:hypothetical protein